MPYKFTFKDLEDTNNKFSCILQCSQCSYVNNKNNKRCRNKSCRGVPLCWIHLLKEKKLRIKKSSLKNAGLGLWAIDKSKKNTQNIFKKDDVIIAYVGEKTTPEILTKRYKEKTAIYALCESNVCVDSACVRGAASYINHSSSPQKINVYFDIDESTNQFIIVAKKNIKNNTELFVSYGREYRMNENIVYSTSSARLR
jgi:hypothetical protein